MTAKLTITLSDEVLKALRASKSITVALQSGGGRAAPAPRATSARRSAGGGGAAKGAGGFRGGSLPAKLVSWAKGRKKPFSVPEVMKKLKIRRGHASMLIAYATKAGAVKRVERGAYKAA